MTEERYCINCKENIIDIANISLNTVVTCPKCNKQYKVIKYLVNEIEEGGSLYFEKDIEEFDEYV
jgi:DNA-directed RNA polymerase subunit RPC12/RpoP